MNERHVFVLRLHKRSRMKIYKLAHQSFNTTSMRKFLLIILLGLLNGKAALSQKENNVQGWSISVLPASVRLDPVTNKIIEERFSAVKTGLSGKENLLEKNWIYDGRHL